MKNMICYALLISVLFLWVASALAQVAGQPVPPTPANAHEVREFKDDKGNVLARWLVLKNSSGLEVKHGWSQAFTTEGKIWKEQWFVGGTLHGLCREWHRDAYVPPAATRIIGEPGKSGPIFQESYYVDGLMHGTQRTWRSNGLLWTIGGYEYGKPVGTHTIYGENGFPMQEANYKGGVRDGKFTEWYAKPTSQKSVEGQFRDDKREGHWTFWQYNGNKDSEGEFVNDQKSGVWKEWDKNGNPAQDVEYKAGKPIGK